MGLACCPFLCSDGCHRARLRSAEVALPRRSLLGPSFAQVLTLDLYSHKSAGNVKGGRRARRKFEALIEGGRAVE